MLLSPAVYKRLSKELQALTGQPHEGIRVKINEEDLADVQAFILGPGLILFSQVEFIN